MKCANSFSILIWANKTKADANGEIPMYARVTVMGKRAEISLKKKVNPKKWDAKTGFLRGSGDDVRTVNNYINKVTQEIFKIFSELQQNGNHFSAEEIKNRYTDAPAKRPTLLVVFEAL